MNKKLLFTIIIFAVVFIAFGFYTVRYSLDPFGAPPKGTSPNCGPEERYKFDVTIDSSEEFVNFIKTNRINQWVRLDNFKNITPDMNYEDIESAEVDWNKVLNDVKTETAGTKTFFVLNYNVYGCGTGMLYEPPRSDFTLKMTPEGHVSVYGCCGD